MAQVTKGEIDENSDKSKKEQQADGLQVRFL
jgi:hypothetical protein